MSHSNKSKQSINHLTQTFNDSKIQLARKIRTDILSLYRNMNTLGAPEMFKMQWSSCIFYCKTQVFS